MMELYSTTYRLYRGYSPELVVLYNLHILFKGFLYINNSPKAYNVHLTWSTLYDIEPQTSIVIESMLTFNCPRETRICMYFTFQEANDLDHELLRGRPTKKFLADLGQSDILVRYSMPIWV